MLINLSNHPFDQWDNQHKQAALSQFGNVVDLPFPEVDPSADADAVFKLASEFITLCNSILCKSNKKGGTIHISGEPSFLFQFVTLAKAQDIPCVCSTTRRLVTNDGNIKTSVFQFVQFRKYF